MRDFLGQELSPGDYCTFPGGGNGSGSYGLLLFKVVKVSDTSVQCKRLRVDYPDFKVETCRVKYSKSTVKKAGKLTKVIPPPNMIEVFENPEEHRVLISTWVHGQKIIDWDNLTWVE